MVRNPRHFFDNNLHASGTETGTVFLLNRGEPSLLHLLSGLIADRYFNAEKILGVLHIVGQRFLYQVYSIGSGNDRVSPVVFYYLLLYMILFMPTLALVNSISFNQMTNTEKQFPGIRVLGTIGWIIAGLAISFVFLWDSEANIKAGMLKNTFLMASIASLVLGMFSFTLPKTPPKVIKGTKVKVSEILGLDALKLLKDKNYLIFFIASILIAFLWHFIISMPIPFFR